MMLRILTISLLLLFSCYQGTEQPYQVVESKPKAPRYRNLDGLRFDFKAEYKIPDTKGEPNIIGIPELHAMATLHNDNDDTVYYLSGTCYHELGYYKYDTSKYLFYPPHTCFGDNPITLKIPPGGRAEQEVFIMLKEHDLEQLPDSMILGLDLFRLEKDIDFIEYDVNYDEYKTPTVLWETRPVTRKKI